MTIANSRKITAWEDITAAVGNFHLAALLGFQNKANERLHDLVNKTRILIIASHSRQLLLANCSRIVWLEYGKVKMNGDVETVANAYFGNQ
ncbi:hypothetical protein ACTJJ7_05995 [Phyllobacterium sp. 22229]|uniref:hypothetical protein n=1 Tax=Phyllobacterium sp. 22229 TaxID=3453895 RepID=UPI003F87E00B